MKLGADHRRERDDVAVVRDPPGQALGLLARPVIGDGLGPSDGHRFELRTWAQIFARLGGNHSEWTVGIALRPLSDSFENIFSRIGRFRTHNLQMDQERGEEGGPLGEGFEVDLLVGRVGARAPRMPRPSSVGRPRAAVKLPSEPPPVEPSPSSRPIARPTVAGPLEQVDDLPRSAPSAGG